MFVEASAINKSLASRAIVVAVALTFSIFGLVSTASALPWDTDLFKQQSYKANELTRSPVTGTVPLGFKHFTMTPDEAAKQLKNPTPATLSSTWRGKRLWNANCLTCHGKLGAGKSVVGPLLKVPSLLTDFYRGREDGRVLAVIYNGQAGMPRYGFKFSRAELWDLVNYLRFLQGRDVEGMSRVAEGKE